MIGRSPVLLFSIPCPTMSSRTRNNRRAYLPRKRTAESVGFQDDLPVQRRPRIHIAERSETLTPRSIISRTSDASEQESDILSQSRTCDFNLLSSSQQTIGSLSSRAFDQLRSTQRDIAQRAENIIREYTLFESPLLKPQELLDLVESAWRSAESELELSRVERDKNTQSWVC